MIFGGHGFDIFFLGGVAYLIVFLPLVLAE